MTEPDGILRRVKGVPTDPTTEVAALYAACCPRLIGLLILVGGSRGDAEEVAQEAFVRLLENGRKVLAYDDPEAWLRTVAVRLLISRHRRHRVARLALPRLVGGPQPEAPPTDDLIDLAVALRRLPVEQRAVVVLHHLDDRSVEEVASTLRIPVGTVKSRLARARAALAPHLAAEEIA